LQIPVKEIPFSSKSACSSSWRGGYRGKGCDGAGSDPDPDEAGCFPLMGLSAGNDEMVPAFILFFGRPSFLGDVELLYSTREEIA